MEIADDDRRTLCAISLPGWLGSGGHLSPEMVSDSTGSRLPTEVPGRELYARLLLAASLVVGTGGHVIPQLSATSSVDTVVARKSSSNNTLRRGRSLFVSDQLANVRAIFGFSAKQLADVLRVSRPTIYAWIDGTTEPREHNRERINLLERLAMAWQERSSETLNRHLNSRLWCDRTLLELLSASSIDQGSVTEAFNVFASEMKKARGMSIADRLDSAGFTRPPAEAQQNLLSRYTARVDGDND